MQVDLTTASDEPCTVSRLMLRALIGFSLVADLPHPIRTPVQRGCSHAHAHRKIRSAHGIQKTDLLPVPKGQARTWTNHANRVTAVLPTSSRDTL